MYWSLTSDRSKCFKVINAPPYIFHIIHCRADAALHHRDRTGDHCGASHITMTGLLLSTYGYLVDNSGDTWSHSKSLSDCQTAWLAHAKCCSVTFYCFRYRWRTASRFRLVIVNRMTCLFVSPCQGVCIYCQQVCRCVWFAPVRKWYRVKRSAC